MLTQQGALQALIQAGPEILRGSGAFSHKQFKAGNLEISCIHKASARSCVLAWGGAEGAGPRDVRTHARARAPACLYGGLRPHMHARTCKTSLQTAALACARAQAVQGPKTQGSCASASHALSTQNIRATCQRSLRPAAHRESSAPRGSLVHARDAGCESVEFFLYNAHHKPRRAY